MKKMVFMLAALLCCAVLIPTAYAEAGERAFLTGSAEVEAPADFCVIRFEVSGYGRTAERADGEAAAVLATVRERLGEYGSIIEESYYTHEGFSGTRICAVRCMLLETARVGELQEILALLHASGVSAIGETVGFCNDSEKYEAEALRLAVADALVRAETVGVDAARYSVEDCGGFVCGYVPYVDAGSVGVRFCCTVRVSFCTHPENN